MVKPAVFFMIGVAVLYILITGKGMKVVQAITG